MQHLLVIVAHARSIALLGVAFFLTACSSSVADENTGIAECDSYVHALSRCASVAGSTVASERTAMARQTFVTASKDKDDAAREKLAAQCRAAEAQLSRACR
ncbi:hypothetical protein LVJ94_28550 [Pendulispora rubella]|uniref:Uncharacterized protein n=1 Tax=Pendulispora rubella TaxID=2741070 RepID=A0ABZ2KQS9_9BACT